MTDRFGNENSACYLDGDANHALRCRELLSVNDSFTFSCWVKAHKETGLGREQAYGILAANIGCTFLQFSVPGDDDHVAMCLGLGTNGICLCEHGKFFFPVVFCHETPIGNDWTHVAYTVSNNEPAKVYINGMYVHSAVDTGRRKSFRIPPDTTEEGFDGIGYGRFSGAIDDIKIFDRALSASQIEALSRE